MINLWDINKYSHDITGIVALRSVEMGITEAFPFHRRFSFNSLVGGGI